MAHRRCSVVPRSFSANAAPAMARLGAATASAARALNPPPADLTVARDLAHVTPLEFYQRVTIGVAGTAMPAFETRLPPADRWAVALYASTLRQGAPAGDVPAALRVVPDRCRDDGLGRARRARSGCDRVASRRGARVSASPGRAACECRGVHLRARQDHPSPRARLCRAARRGRQHGVRRVHGIREGRDRRACEERGRSPPGSRPNLRTCGPGLPVARPGPNWWESSGISSHRWNRRSGR